MIYNAARIRRLSTKLQVDPYKTKKDRSAHLGVDGFRIDAVPYLLEDPELRDEPLDPDFNTSINCTAPSNNTACYGMLIHNRTMNYFGIHEVIKRWRNVSNNYTDRFFVGETFSPWRQW